MAAARTVEKRLSELRPFERNPRRISVERLGALKRTLEDEREMLQARPLVALPDGRVICGNMRLRAAAELGWKTIPTIVVDLDDVRARKWALLDNNGFGEWDDTLPAFLAELAQAGVELELTGFSPEEIDRLVREAARASRVADPDAAPEPPKTPRSKPGEVYELGPHRLMCGDSTSAEHVATLTGGGVAEMLWTDPPYGVEYVGKTRNALTIRNDSGEQLPDLLRAAFATADRVLAPGARFYCAAPAGPRELDFRVAIDAVGWRVHQTLVWVKDVFVLGHSDYHYQHEPILYGHKPGDGRPGRGRHPGSRWYGDHSQSSVFNVARPKRNAEHPTMKPVELIDRHLRNSTKPGDAVLDLFGGSGSTLIACEQTGRRAFLMEIDPVYCDVIRQRYEDYTAA